jgi:hypothetical protein
VLRVPILLNEAMESAICGSSIRAGSASRSLFEPDSGSPVAISSVIIANAPLRRSTPTLRVALCQRDARQSHRKAKQFRFADVIDPCTLPFDRNARPPQIEVPANVNDFATNISTIDFNVPSSFATSSGPSIGRRRKSHSVSIYKAWIIQRTQDFVNPNEASIHEQLAIRDLPIAQMLLMFSSYLFRSQSNTTLEHPLRVHGG